ncbi:MAG: nucleotidyltransferase family protein, partial [Nitrospiria bacterium]
PQSDVDLLVHDEDLDLAHRLLIEQGFGEAWPRAFYQDHYHWVYRRGSILLELHWALKAPGTCSPNLTRIWDQARWRLAEGVEFLEMAPEDLLTYLAVNKAHQRFPALLDYVDLEKILQLSPFDWERLCHQALRDKTAGPIWFGLSVAKDLLAAPVPDDVLRVLSKPLHARLSIILKKLLNLQGGPLHIPLERLDGPTGRLYEIFFEGQPSAIFHMIRPLVFPSRARVGVLAKGSYPRYYYNQVRRFLEQVTHS